MISYRILVFSCVVRVSWCVQDLTFPPGFKFGAATASYQVEGAWNVSEKSESIWDRFTHQYPEKVNEDTGDVACDSYHQWERDIEIATELGLHFYRFSVSWPRVLPTGYRNRISEDGKNYYSNLIDGLLDKGIEPVITLYHWDLPQSLQDLGGWANPLIAEWFGDFARVVYSLYADRVKVWLTINEPLVICDVGYNTGMMAPGIIDTTAAYLCSKNILMAHATAWRIYDKEFRAKNDGMVSLANHIIWYQGIDEENEELAELARENCAGKYSHPIFSKEGGWPPSLEKFLAEVSKERGFPRSILPAFTQKEIEFIRGTYDFYAINHYTSRLVRKARPGEQLQPWPLWGGPDLNIALETHPTWKAATSSWFVINPEGLRRQLAWLKKQYGDIQIMITENGLATYDGIQDYERVKYYRDYLQQVLLAIKEDGVRVTHYTAWTLIDNFEWMDAYTVKFGLYEVNFTDPMRTRTQRDSARYYAKIIKTHSLDVPIEHSEL